LVTLSRDNLRLTTIKRCLRLVTIRRDNLRLITVDGDLRLIFLDRNLIIGGLIRGYLWLRD